MIWDSASHLLPGLLPASYRGIDFDIPDASSEPGRRIAEHLFPGVDQAAYDDMGKLPKFVSITGLIVGDDYIARAKAMEAAFERAGPAMLVHPWLGVMRVLAIEPGFVSFSAKELRVARVEGTFTVIGPSGGRSSAGVPAVTRLLGAAASLITEAGGLARSADRGASSPIVTRALARSVRIGANALAANPVTASVTSFIADTPEAFAAGLASRDDTLLARVPAWAGVSAVAAAAEALQAPLEEPSTAPRGIVTSLSSYAGRMAAQAAEAPSPTDAAFLLAEAAASFATTLKLSTVVEHDSRASARGLLSRLVETSETFEVPLSVLAATPRYGGAASLLARALGTALAALREDINETIGRLPRVLTVPITTETDAFLIANHLYGDTPENLEEGYRSIVQRNRPRHPAVLPPGEIEALR